MQSIPIVAKEGPQKATRPATERLEPEAIIVKDSTGVDFVCFTPSQGKEVARIFTDYHTLWAYALSLEVDVLNFEREIKLLNDNADRWEGLYLESDERGNTYKTAFMSSHALLMDSEKNRYERNRWGWVPWSITALVAVVGGIAYASK